MAGELTTLMLFKRYANRTTADGVRDVQIAQLITDACGLMADRCGRTWTATTYRAWLDGSGATTLLLPQWPVLNLYRVSTAVDDWFRVTFTGGTHADFSIDGTNAILHSVDTAGAETTTALALASYPIVTDLATAIEAVSGWSVTQEANFTTQPTALVRPVLGAWCLTPDYIDIEGPDEGAAGVRVISEGQRGIEAVAGGRFPAGHANVFAWYKAGYTLPVDNAQHTELDTVGTVPAGLQLCAHQIIKDVFDGRDEDGNMDSEKEGDYSYKRGAIASAIDRHWPDLSRYARIEI